MGAHGMSVNRAICWLRRDLRLHDHTALSHALSSARETVVVFVYDSVILDALPNRADRRVTFIHASLEEIDAKLRERGSRLLTMHGDPTELIPRLATELKANLVVAAHDDDPYALLRDREVGQSLGKLGVTFTTVKDHVVFERQEILNQSGLPHRVYTPYMKTWRARLTPEEYATKIPDLRNLCPQPSAVAAKTGNHSLEEIGFSRAILWLKPGAQAGKDRLAEFETHIDDYGKQRDFPALDGTSGISVHLRHGTVSIRECVRAALRHSSAGADKWLNELIWREFYHAILANFPEVVETSFQPLYRDLQWPGDPSHYSAWQAGQTGFPIVDAAMRCFRATGWMHNRLRMVVAMFLTKDLLLDYRLGEKEFADGLLDFELASNNGGWQWSASVGVDAQPYFRIFNPISQSRKFDPDGTFIREWCPELRDLDNEKIHWPHAESGSLFPTTPAGYPGPIVDHATQRDLALALFQSHRASHEAGS